MRKGGFLLILLAGAVAQLANAQDVNHQAMRDAQKVGAHLKSSILTRYDAGSLKGGSAVYDAKRDLAFWVKGDTLYAVNERARAAAPDLAKAPDEITYDAVYEASADSPLCREIRPTEIAMEGRDLSPEAARTLEDTVRSNPSDLWARTMLLGYYRGQEYTSDEARTQYEQHVLWLVKNAPSADVVGSVDARLDAGTNPGAYGEAAKALQEHVAKDPKNVRLLANAAEFFTTEDKSYAVECLTRCVEMEPNNPRWYEKLGFIQSLDARSTAFFGSATPPDRDGAKKALAAQERALELTSDQDKRLILTRNMAETAFAAGNMEKARSYASTVLKGSGFAFGWDRGNRIHAANTILGKIALNEGDIDKAKDHLIAAGRCGGSPQLDSFGPDMSLATELLEKGEKDAVVKYLELCGGFWNKNATDLWISEIRAGRPVDLNPMLAAMTDLPMDSASALSFFRESPPVTGDPLLYLPMPTEQLRLIDAMYGVPLLLLLLAVLWIRCFSNWEYLWILAPLAFAFAAPTLLAQAIPGLAESLFGLGGGSIQHLVATYFGSLALLLLLSDLVARLKTWQIVPAAVAVMAGAGLVGTINYPHRYHVLAEILTFVAVLTISVFLARGNNPGMWRQGHFIRLLFIFIVVFMLIVWPVTWVALQLAVFGQSPFMLLSYLPMHLLISLVNGVGLCLFLTPFLLLVGHVPLYRKHFRRMLRIPE